MGHRFPGLMLNLMVAFIPFFGLMVAFIPKIALMATIRFTDWRQGEVVSGG